MKTLNTSRLTTIYVALATSSVVISCSGHENPTNTRIIEEDPDALFDSGESIELNDLDLIVKATIGGTDGNDDLRGTNGHDTMWGGDGADTIRGLGGHDSLTGGHGPDEVRGSYGMDTVVGNGHNDYLAGGQDVDTIAGGNGNDTCAAQEQDGEVSGCELSP